MEELKSYLESLDRVRVRLRVRLRAKDYRAIPRLSVRQVKKGLRVILKITERPNIVKSMHDEIAHWQAQTTNFFIYNQFWWPTIKRDIRDYVHSSKAFQLSGPFSKSNIFGIQPVVVLFHTF